MARLEVEAELAGLGEEDVAVFRTLHDNAVEVLLLLLPVAAHKVPEEAIEGLHQVLGLLGGARFEGLEGAAVTSLGVEQIGRELAPAGESKAVGWWFLS